MIQNLLLVAECLLRERVGNQSAHASVALLIRGDDAANRTVLTIHAKILFKGVALDCFVPVNLLQCIVGSERDVLGCKSNNRAIVVVEIFENSGPISSNKVIKVRKLRYRI